MTDIKTLYDIVLRDGKELDSLRTKVNIAEHVLRLSRDKFAYELNKVLVKKCGFRFNTVFDCNGEIFISVIRDSQILCTTLADILSDKPLVLQTIEQIIGETGDELKDENS